VISGERDRMIIGELCSSWHTPEVMAKVFRERVALLMDSHRQSLSSSLRSKDMVVSLAVMVHITVHMVCKSSIPLEFGSSGVGSPIGGCSSGLPLLL
jgi:hypothetical protein